MQNPRRDQRRVRPRRSYLANLREAAQRIRATQNLMHAKGMTEEVNYRELLTRLTTALAMTKASYVEA